MILEVEAVDQELEAREVRRFTVHSKDMQHTGPVINNYTWHCKTKTN